MKYQLTLAVAGGSFGNHGIDGGQGEAVRVPLAGSTLVAVPGSGHTDETMRSLLALSDVMCTGHHAAVSAGVTRGAVVAVVGDGAVGLCALRARKMRAAIRGWQRLPRVAWVVVALPVLWLAQGSTFIAIKIGVASVPPFLLSAARFLVVGILLLGWSAFRSGWRLRVERQEALLGAISGVGMVLVGQGSASWSSQHLAPGLVAVLTSTIPLWAALIGLLTFRTRLGGKLGSFGLVAGFAGVGFLAWPATGPSIALGPALAVAAGAAGWGAAVVVLSRSGKLRRPLLVTALQALGHRGGRHPGIDDAGHPFHPPGRARGCRP